MSHRKVRRSLAGYVQSLLQTKSLPIELRDYQRETFESVLRWLKDGKGSRRGYVQHATGLGKTILFASLASACSGSRSLIIVPNKLLVEQTAKEVYRFTKGEVGHVSSLGKISDENGEVVAMRGHRGQRIVITTDASFKLRAKQLAEEVAPDLIVRDECHWSYTEKSQEALGLFPDALIIGFSATPDYLVTSAKADYLPVTLDNGQVLYAAPDRIAKAHYEHLIDRRTVRWGIENGHLAPLAWGMLEFDVSLDELPLRDGPAGLDYDDEALRQLIHKHWPLMVETICRLYEDNVYDIRNRQVCAVCPGVTESEELARKIGRFVRTATVTGQTSDVERNEILASFDEDRPTKDTVRFVSSVFVLREGWNTRNAEVCMMLRPTRSRVFYEQFMGRVLRPRRDGRDKVALVLDAYFQNTKFAPLSAPVLFGTPGQEVGEGDILIGPKKNGSRGRKTSSPYLADVRPRLHVVQAVQIEYWTGDDGLTKVGNETWGSQNGCANALGLSLPTVIRRVDATACRSLPGRSVSGKQIPLYALADVEAACADLLGRQNQVGDDGFATLDGEKWGTVHACANLLGISHGLLSRRVQARRCRSRLGKTSGGQPVTLYALADVEAACADLLGRQNQVGDDGFATLDGEKWGTVNACANLLGISHPTAIKRIGGRCRSCPGKVSNGHHVTLYALADVEAACADLLGRQNQVGDDGFATLDGERWGTVHACANLLGVSYNNRLCKLVRGSRCRSRPGKASNGHLVTIYALTDVKAAVKARTSRQEEAR